MKEKTKTKSIPRWIVESGNTKRTVSAQTQEDAIEYFVLEYFTGDNIFGHLISIIRKGSDRGKMYIATQALLSKLGLEYEAASQVKP